MKRFVIFGNTSFTGIPQREHSLAIALARSGHTVVFIEGMPSLAHRFRSMVRPDERVQKGRALPKSLTVLTPPTVPSFFRSSVTPVIDRFLFRRWFRKYFGTFDWRETIVMAMFPYWWSGFVDRPMFPGSRIVYDCCDVLEVPSRTDSALRRMQLAEARLINEADLITYSARMMGTWAKFASRNILYMPNAVPDTFISENTPRTVDTRSPVIGFIGSVDERWIDLELLEKIAVRNPGCRILLYGPATPRSIAMAKQAHNISVMGAIAQEDVPRAMASFSVGIIPFLRNNITQAVNPLKFFEYLSAGMPIVATRTNELEQYADLISLAGDHEAFISQVQSALKESDPAAERRRREFAAQQSWSARAVRLLEALEALR